MHEIFPDPRQMAKLRLYQIIAAIPKGKVASYGQLAHLAEQTGAARWVGYCLRHLPEGSNLPWQRVIKANGKLAFPVNTAAYWRQREKLESEGILIQNHKINMKLFQWQPKQ